MEAKGEEKGVERLNSPAYFTKFFSCRLEGLETLIGRSKRLKKDMIGSQSGRMYFVQAPVWP